MATKEEYYQKILASQQDEIKSQQSKIAALQSEITSLQTSITTLISKIESIETDLSESKTVSATPENREVDLESDSIRSFCEMVASLCDQTISKHYTTLPDRFVEKSEFSGFKETAEKTYLKAPEYATDKNTLEKRLASIESRLGQGFSLLAINLYTDKASGHHSIFKGLSRLKGIEFEGCLPILVLLTIFSLAAYLIFSI